LSANIQWKINDSMTLTSVSAYRTLWNQFAEQTDSSPIGVEILLEMQRHKQFTQELRLSGKASNLDYTIGGFYLTGNGGLNARVGLPWVKFDFIHGPDSTPAETKAVFANAEYHVTDQFSIDGGVRYSDEKKDYTYFRHNGDGSLITDPAGWNGLVQNVNNSTAHFQGTHTDYRLALQYQIDPDMMVYLQTSTGYKGGGVDPRPFYPSQDKAFAPETMTAYEAGFKSYLFNRTLRLNAAVFYNNYKDIQLTLSNCPEPPVNGVQYPAAPCALPANVGSAHIKGAELEIEAHPMGGLELDASASYLNFEYYSLTGGPTVGVTTSMITPYTPTKKASVGVQYEIPVGAGTLTPRLDVTYQGSEFTTAINDPVWGQIPSYTVSNAHLTWKDGDGKWQSQLNVSNLTNKLYYLSLFGGNTGAGYLSGTPAMPREWSISVKRSFK
jgi:iron complex outermembrane receptor protein